MPTNFEALKERRRSAFSETDWCNFSGLSHRLSGRVLAQRPPLAEPLDKNQSYYADSGGRCERQWRSAPAAAATSHL